jgi:hypothetical protein
MDRIIVVAGIAVLLVVAIALLARAPPREKYLIYPYIDLDTPGARGNYYALSEQA